MNQVKFLCRNIWEVEWSGILFCSTKGEFGKTGFEITAEYIFPMNKGSQAYTEFETTPDYIDFMMENPQSMQWQRHLVHSHNNMSVFFSGTDRDEISENSEFYNYYISLIVNNKEEMCAKIAFRGKTKEEVKRSVSYKGDNGKSKTFTVNNSTEKEVVYIYNCDILKQEDELVDEYYKNRVNYIIQEAEKKKVVELSKHTTFREQPKFWTEEPLDYNTPSSHSDNLNNFVCTLLSLDNLNIETNVAKELSAVRKKLGLNLSTKNETDVKIYCQSICENFTKFYNDYFSDPINECLIDTLEETIEILEEYCASNWVADQVYSTLICYYEELNKEADVITK